MSKEMDPSRAAIEGLQECDKHTASVGLEPPIPARGHPVKWTILIGFLLLGGMVGGIGYYQLRGGVTVEDLQREAGIKHETGDFLAAIDCYRQLLERTPPEDWRLQARWSFLLGAAHEGLWNEDRGPSTSFEEGIENYQHAVVSDKTESQLYAVESLLAKSELLVSRARRSIPMDEHSLVEGERILAELINNPLYHSNPTVIQGIPHRRLAILIRNEKPLQAIDLFSESIKRQRGLEQGYETLEIGLIYRDLLDDPDRAVESFRQAENNCLASEKVRELAKGLLDGLQLPPIETPGSQLGGISDPYPGKDSEP